MWEMAVVSEVSKGDMPPRNPYYLKDQLHYYWLMHLLPSAEHRALPGIRLEQLLLTNPGERVNRPDFGSGLLDLVFAPNSPELAAALQFSMQAAVQQWLGDLIQVDSLEVVSEDATLRVELQYVVRRTGEVRTTAVGGGP